MATPASNEQRINALDECVKSLTKRIADAIRRSNNYINLYDTFDESYEGKEGFSPLVSLQPSYPYNPYDPHGLRLERLVQFQDLYPGNAIIYGGVSLVPGTTDMYACWASAYIINGVLYASAEDFVFGTVQTNPAPSSPNERIDLFVVQRSPLTDPIQPQIVLVEGDNAISPLKPSLDLSYQVELGFKLHTSDEVTPPEITTEQIYDENAEEPTEWDNYNTDAGINIADTATPLRNNIHTSVPSTKNPNPNLKVSWVNDAPIPYNGDTKVCFRLLVNGTFDPQNARQPSIIVITLREADELRHSITLRRENIINYGYDPTTEPANGHLVIIPLSHFVHYTRAPEAYDEIEFDFDGLASLSLDDIYLQDGVIINDPPVGVDTWLELTDTPSTYPGSEYAPKVNDANDGLTFYRPAAEYLNESGDLGIRRLGADSGYYGNLGQFAVDLHWSDENTNLNGATGTYSAAIGGKNQELNVPYSGALGGVGNQSLLGTYAQGGYFLGNGNILHAWNYHSFAQGYLNVIGTLNQTGGNGIGYYSGTLGAYNNLYHGRGTFALGAGLIHGGAYCTVVGAANVDVTNTNATSSWSTGNATANPAFVIGIGNIDLSNPASPAYTRKNGAIHYRTGLWNFTQYGSGTFTGTEAFDLAVTSTGNVVEKTIKLKSFKRTLSASEVNNIGTTQQELLASKSGTLYGILKLIVMIRPGSTPFDANTLNFRYGTSGNYLFQTSAALIGSGINDQEDLQVNNNWVPYYAANFNVIGTDSVATGDGEVDIYGVYFEITL